MNISMKSGGIIVFSSEYVTINIILLNCTMLNFFSLFHSLIIITDLHRNKLTSFARIKFRNVVTNYHAQSGQSGGVISILRIKVSIIQTFIYLQFEDNYYVTQL